MQQINIATHFLTQRKKYIQAFWMFQLLLAILFIATVALPQLRRYWGEWGSLSANASIVFFIASMLPGILKRLQVTGWLSKLQVVLMSYRRQTGIAMFLFALYHAMWNRNLFLLITNQSILPEYLFEIAGALSLTLAFPLFLSSNDMAIKMMGKWWKILHKSVYPIIWGIFLHVWLVTGWDSASIAILVLAIAEIISWIVHLWHRMRTT